MNRETKWKTCYLQEDKGIQLPLEKIPNERIMRITTHNVYRKVYLISGVPFPDDRLKAEWLYINHSRKKIRRRK